MGRITETRSRIVCAAEDVVIRDGVSKLTLEAAAHEAGVSKGGVLYHFPSRAALVAAMVDRFVVSFDADLARHSCAGGRPGDFVRAYIDATVSPTHEAGDPREQHLGAALLAGVASDPDLLEPLRARFAAWQASIESDGIDEALGTIVRLACDGMWLSDLFGLAPLDGPMRAAAGAELRRLIDSAAGNSSAPVSAASGDGASPAPAGRVRRIDKSRPAERSAERRRQAQKETASPSNKPSRLRS